MRVSYKKNIFKFKYAKCGVCKRRQYIDLSRCIKCHECSRVTCDECRIKTLSIFKYVRNTAVCCCFPIILCKICYYNRNNLKKCNLCKHDNFPNCITMCSRCYSTICFNCTTFTRLKGMYNKCLKCDNISLKKKIY